MRFRWIVDNYDDVEYLYYSSEDDLSFIVKIFTDIRRCILWNEDISLRPLFNVVSCIINNNNNYWHGDVCDIKSLIDIYVAGLLL